MARAGFLVESSFDITLKNGHVYPLLPGDILVKDSKGTYTKEAVGITLVNLTIGDSSIESHTRPVKFKNHHLDYQIVEDEERRSSGTES